MRYREAISLANEARPNTVNDGVKYTLLNNLERRVAGLMQVEPPANPFPGDGVLLMGAPYENIYVYYLQAMCDYYMQDFDLYTADFVMFNNEYADAAAAWRRAHPTVVNARGARV